MLESTDVRSFRVRTPSLHETFIRLVGGKGESDAE